MNIRNSLSISLVAFAFFFAPPFSLFADEAVKFSLSVDFGEDEGQNFGSLVEAVDSDGKSVFGAGFPAVWNTQSRINRRSLTVFVSPPEGEWQPKVERLPRASEEVGVSLFDWGGNLYAKTRNPLKDSRLRRWDEDSGTWIEDKDTPAFQMSVANGILSNENGRALWNGDLIETEPNSPSSARVVELYFAGGCLLYRSIEKGVSNELVALPWNKDSGVSGEAVTLKLRSPKEFIYAWGQLGEDAVATTNTGGVYRFNGESWKAVLEPVVGESFQVYSMINFYDSLLLGHYPTGELFEYNGTSVAQKPGWPPVMEGVSPRAREAQSTGIYGGQLLVGVWPWGEVWRYDRHADHWHLLQRMFSHPPLTDEVVHPWEKEMLAANPKAARNWWGHRIMAMVPLNNSFYLSTSAKQAVADPSGLEFIKDPAVADEYGAIHRFTLPGQLTVQTDWKIGPTTFEFVLSKERLSVSQDGKSLGSTEIGTQIPNLDDLELQWGKGIFGNSPGTFTATKADKVGNP